MIESREQLLGRVAKRALVTPLSLALLTTCGLCALVPATWPVLALGLVVEASVLHVLIRDPNFVRAVRETEQQADWRQRAARLRQVREKVGGDTAAILGRIHDLQERLLREASATPSLISPASSAGLLDRCAHLAEKRHQMLLYLRVARPSELQNQASQIEAKLENASDALARKLYSQALEQKRGELESYCAIQQAVERIDGQLDAIECSFSHLLGRLIRLKSADDAHAAAAHLHVTRELADMHAHLEAVENSVNEMLVSEMHG